MSTAKPQQPADGQKDESEDLIAELARMMATNAQGEQAQPNEAEGDAPVTSPEPPASPPSSSLRIPGEDEKPATPATGFKFDFEVPKAPSVSTPEPLTNWQERLNRGNAPASPINPTSSVRLEPTLERVPVDPPAPAQSFVAPPVSDTHTSGPVPPPTDDGHDAIADLIAAELDESAAPEPVQPEAAEPTPATKPLLRAVNYPAPPPRPESDRFASPPVFGVGTHSAETPAPEAEQPLDPMDEIESLIGAAVQSDHGIRSVVTPTAAPAPAAPPASAPSHEAEAAILAAAAASGVEISRVAAEPKFSASAADEAPPQAARRVRAPRQGRGFRPFIGPAIAVVLLLVAGTGLYWVLGMGHDDGAAPVLTADTSPTKQAPAAPAAPATPAAASAVFDELDGKVPTAGDEQLVSRDQSTGAEVTPAAVQDSGEGLANRKVRTVTVRPDGTIVNAEDTLAGAEALPVERPNVPDVPDGNLDASDLLSAATQGQQVADTSLSVAPTPAPDTAAETATPASVDAPVPMPRPTDLATLRQPAAANDLIGTLATENENTAPAANTSASSTPAPAAYVQLSSQRDLNVAQQSLIGINSRWGKLLNGVLPEVQKVDLGARGTYYRVRVPANSLSSANYLCQQIKSSGGDCLVTN
jgi:hypothetical protein